MPKARLRLDGSDPINRGLVGFWLTAGVGVGALSDISPYRRSATFVGTAASTSVAARLGRGLEFDGSSQAINTPVTNFSSPAGSVVWWQRPTTAFNSGGFRGIWGQVTGAGEFSAQVFLDNNWYIGWRQGGTDRRLTFAATADNWRTNAVSLYVFTYSAAGSKLYLNGSLLASTASAPVPFDLAAAFSFGQQNPGSTWFAGGMWAPRLIAQELSTHEISRLYRDPWAGTARRVHYPDLARYEAPAIVPPDPDTDTTPHGTIRRRGRYRVWDDVPNELEPVVALAENYADTMAVQRAVDDALMRFARIGARTSANRRNTLIDEMRRAVVAAVERAAEEDDEEALAALL